MDSLDKIYQGNTNRENNSNFLSQITVIYRIKKRIDNHYMNKVF